MKKKGKFLTGLFAWLVLIGAFNWGLVGLFNFNLVEKIFGMGTFADVVYVLVGIGAVLGLFQRFK